MKLDKQDLKYAARFAGLNDHQYQQDLDWATQFVKIVGIGLLLVYTVVLSILGVSIYV